MDILNTYLPVALVVLGAVISVLVVIAPLTKSHRDDDALAFLQKIMDYVGKLVGARVK